MCWFYTREISTYNNFCLIIFIIFIFLFCFLYLVFDICIIWLLLSNKRWFSERFSLLSRYELLLVENFLFCVSVLYIVIRLSIFILILIFTFMIIFVINVFHFLISIISSFLHFVITSFSMLLTFIFEVFTVLIYLCAYRIFLNLWRGRTLFKFGDLFFWWISSEVTLLYFDNYFFHSVSIFYYLDLLCCSIICIFVCNLITHWQWFWKEDKHLWF